MTIFAFLGNVIACAMLLNFMSNQIVGFHDVAKRRRMCEAAIEPNAKQLPK